MLIIYGRRKKLKIVKPLGVQKCPNCGHKVEMALAKEKCNLHIFYIPVFFFTGWRMTFCPNCGTVAKLSASEYRSLKKSAAPISD